MRTWLKRIRRKKRLTQRELAKALDITESYYGLIEAGKRQKRMDATLAAKLSVIFEIPVEKIIEWERRES